MVAAGLVLYGHTADAVTTTAAALECTASLEYSLIVVSTPGAAAFLREAKQLDPTLAAVILAAHPNPGEAVELLRGGATALAIDYIVKPEESLIRRVAEDIDRHFTKIQIGDLFIDRKLRRAYWRENQIPVTPTQHQILTAFALSPYQDLTYQVLAMAVYGEYRSHEHAMKALRGQVSRLRTELKKAAGRDILIAGYDDGNRLIPERGRYPLKPAPVTERVTSGG